MESNTLQAVPAIFTDIRSALYHGFINLASKSHLPSLQWNHHLITMHFVHGVKHLTGSTSNIHRYLLRPLSGLHLSCLTEPSNVTPLKSSSNSYALCSWCQTPSGQYQQYSQIFAAPSIEVALNIFLSAIYRYPKTISGFMGSCFVKALPEIFTFISSVLYRRCIHLASQRHLPSLQWNH